ncbi:hypothetical protein AgCh_032329 [Apium graveolens]
MTLDRAPKRAYSFSHQTHEFQCSRLEEVDSVHTYWSYLVDYIDETFKPPAIFLDPECKELNPAYTVWYRQDQILLSAILGSCLETIQPHILSAATSCEAWRRLLSSYANSSRSRVISLKAKLIKNPKGTRSVTEYLHDMRSIADELALAQSPILEDDLIVHIITQLGDDFNPIVAAIKVRESSISFSKLLDKLTDFERMLQENDSTLHSTIATANATQKFNSKASHLSKSHTGNSNRDIGYGPFSRKNRHDTRDCRKLAKFMRDNNISGFGSPTFVPLSSPVTNATMSMRNNNQPWLFDSGASHHVTNNPSSLQSLSTYGGPDEIFLGDGSSHGGVSTSGREQQ